MSSNKRARVDGEPMDVGAFGSALELKFEAPSAAPAAATIVVGQQEALMELSPELLPAGMSVEVFKFLVGKITPGDTGRSASTIFTTSAGGMATLVAAVLPAVCSRHNSPLRPHAITALIGPAASDAAKESGGAAIVVVLDDPSYAAGAACAVARAFPMYSMKNPHQPAVHGSVRVGFATRTAPLPNAPYGSCAMAASAVRLAARLVDTPPEQLTTTAFVEEARQAAARLKALGRKVVVEVIAGEALRERGYGGLYGVGKAATEPPALCVLSHVPTTPGRTVCLVGKGIVYDTGGLALKPKEVPVIDRTQPALGRI